MRRLFTIDTLDYILDGTIFSRPSVRAIIIFKNRLAMVYSKKFNYYKFPGGGINPNESQIDALVRETIEETGLTIDKKTINEFGEVYRIQKGYYEDCFIQNNYYYLCDVLDTISEQNLDVYEKEEEFTLVYQEPVEIMLTNFSSHDKEVDDIMLIRENKVINRLYEEGLIQANSIREKIIYNIMKIHTTKLGLIRVQKVFNFDDESSLVSYIHKMLIDKNTIYTEVGKNYYLRNKITITINKFSNTVITAHINKNQ